MAGFVELFKLSKVYSTRRGPAVIVKDFSLNIREGELVALIGHSGCGKSTVLMMTAGLTEMTSGSVVVGAREVSGPGPDRGVVFQSPCLLAWLTAFEIVRLAVDTVQPHATARGRRESTEYYLTLVGLSDCMHKRPRELSQGMQQRVGIARALSLAPTMLLLDEPFGMLDSTTRMELQDVLLSLLARNQKTAMIVTHDVDEALYLSDRVVMMTSGPAAHVGGILEVPFGRPRVRSEVLEDPRYYPLRERLIAFLEDQQSAGSGAPAGRHEELGPRQRGEKESLEVGT
jgi:nitrate ABC transporter ATP-binding subunit